jgi:sugar (pentulose or hexulose) kinase
VGEAFLGIDFGTSGARCSVIDDHAALLYTAQIDLPPSEEDPKAAQVWREVLFDLIAGIPLPIRSILGAIAIDGTSGTALLCDQQGRPLLPPLPYNDDRALSEVEALADIAPPDHITLSASSSLAKLMWFSKQSQFRSAHHFLHQADWLAAQLHGTLGMSDYHNSLKLGYDAAALCYPEWLLALPIQPLLPQVVAPGTIIGTVLPEMEKILGLPSACQIRAGTTDSIAAFLASGASQPGEAVTSLGSTLVLKLLSTTRVDAAAYGIYSHRMGELWLAGGASNSGGAVLKQYFDQHELEALSAQIDPRISSPYDYYPLPKSGERFPINDPALAPRLMPRPEKRVEFLHGLLESMARIEAQGYRLLQQLGATAPSRILTAGGGARNPAWTAIRKRLLGLPVSAAEQTEASYGAAQLAARGTDLLCLPDSGHW